MLCSTLLVLATSHQLCVGFHLSPISVQRKHQPHVHSSVHMAGFGKKPATPGKKPGLSAKKQWDIYNKLVKAGSQSVPISVRVQNTEKWIHVGAVAAEGDDSAQAVQLHKRLIFEHAVRCNPVLVKDKNALECGLPSSDDTVQPSAKVDVSLTPTQCGFEGLPDKSSGYYCSYKVGGGTSTITNIGGRSDNIVADQKDASRKGSP